LLQVFALQVPPGWQLSLGLQSPSLVHLGKQLLTTAPLQPQEAQMPLQVFGTSHTPGDEPWVLQLP
jgi:hypothetical protein